MQDCSVSVGYTVYLSFYVLICLSVCLSVCLLQLEEPFGVKIDEIIKYTALAAERVHRNTRGLTSPVV